MNKTIKRGDIFYVTESNVNTPIGCEIWPERPALIVSNDTTNTTNNVVEIVYLSTSLKKRPSPLHVRVTSGNRPAIAMCEQIHSVDKSRLRTKMGEITSEEQIEIDKTLCFSLGINATSYRSVFKKWENYIREYHIPVVEEVESMAASSAEHAISVLQKQIDILTQERDAYKLLADANQLKLNAITNQHC